MSTIQSCFFRKSPSCKSSCRKMGANAQNIPVRGRFKRCQPSFARCLQCATWAFADRRQLRRRTMDRKYSPRYPEREYFAHSGGKNDNMPPSADRDARGEASNVMIKTTHFSVGLPWFTFLRPGKTLIFHDFEEENPPKSGSFLSCRPPRWTA